MRLRTRGEETNDVAWTVILDADRRVVITRSANLFTGQKLVVGNDNTPNKNNGAILEIIPRPQHEDNYTYFPYKINEHKNSKHKATRVESGNYTYVSIYGARRWNLSTGWEERVKSTWGCNVSTIFTIGCITTCWTECNRENSRETLVRKWRAKIIDNYCKQNLFWEWLTKAHKISERYFIWISH